MAQVSFNDSSAGWLMYLLFSSRIQASLAAYLAFSAFVYFLSSDVPPNEVFVINPSCHLRLRGSVSILLKIFKCVCKLV